MPIYEFYCSDCHRIFNFLSRTIDTQKQPSCPRCGRLKLARRVSSFAISRNRPEPAADGLPDVDESQMERVMAELAGDAENLNEEDPRQMARMMRKLYEATGMQLGGGIEEAIRRMEAGEDPDKIEEEMGHLFDEEDPLAALGDQGIKGMRRRFLPPPVDDTIYEM